jgi:hypothetical protein
MAAVFDDPLAAHAWRRAGLAANEAQAWLDAGLNDPQRAQS